MRSLKENHVLTIANLDSLPADYPILIVITVSEVITLPIIKSFQLISRRLGSKGFPEHYNVSRLSQLVLTKTSI